MLLEVLKLWLIFGLVGDHSLSSLYFAPWPKFGEVLGVSRPFFELIRLVNKALYGEPFHFL